MKTPFTFTTIDRRRIAGFATRSAGVLALLLAFAAGARAQNSPQAAQIPTQEKTSGQAQTPPAANKPTRPQTIHDLLDELAHRHAARAGEPATTAPQKPQDANLTVHGHWTMDIRNPDGSGAHRVEFENALASGEGQLLLGTLLGGSMVPSDWAILLSSTGNLCPADGNPPATATPCILVQSLTSGLLGSSVGQYALSNPGDVFFGLTVSYLPPGAISATSGAGFQLVGTFTVSPSAPAGITINGVESIVGVCLAPGLLGAAVNIVPPLNQAGPSQCLGVTSKTPSGFPTGEAFNQFAFTGATPSIPVSASQIVQVTVTFTFS